MTALFSKRFENCDAMNLKQLARMLDLSQTTVSRALNGYPEVNEETRRRVIGRGQAARLSAEPQRAPAGHRQGRHDRLCAADRRQRRHRSAFRRISVGARRLRALARAGSRAQPGRGRRRGDDLPARRRQQAGRCGLCFSAAPAGPRIALLHQLGLPYLVHGRSEGLDFAYPHLDIDNEGAFQRGGAAAASSSAIGASG